MKKPTDYASPVYIVDGARTPFLKFTGEPGPFSAADLAVRAAKALFCKLPIEASQLDQVIIGCVGPSEEEANIARVIALRTGCGAHVPAFTVQRNCASGLQAIDSARLSIAQGEADLILAGGTEAMSRAFLIFPPSMAKWLNTLNKSKNFSSKAKALLQFRPHYIKPIIGLLKGLTDPIVNLTMGQTAEELAFRFNISRQEMDSYAVESHLRAAQMDGTNEIIPIFSESGLLFEKDNGVRADSSLEKLSTLKPVFDRFGNITAGNSSQISDGAAVVLLASERAVKAYNLPVLGKIVDVQWSGVDPVLMGLGPIHAMTAILQRQKLGLEDLDSVEINEAFAAQVLACREAWQDPVYCKNELNLECPFSALDLSILNAQGGAIAIGHPVGASGARLVLHSLKELERSQGKRAMASLCIGGGQGGAILLERGSN